MLGLRKIRDKLHEAIGEEGNAKNLAGGFAVGVFFSFTPLVSLHMVLALLVAIIFRLSKVAAMAGAWVNNPYTMPFVFYACFRLGKWMMGVHLPTPVFEDLRLTTILRAARPYAAPLFLGTTVVGLLAALLAYVIVYRIVVRVKSARPRS